MKPPHITIAMAVYNGAAHLQEQLASIAAQTHRDWQILAGDDGSEDDSRAILESFAAAYPLICLNGPKQGGAANFLSLIRRMKDHAPADSWLAFSDQDDIWLPERLSRGISALEVLPVNTPALYCSRLWITDAKGKNRRLSAPRPYPPSFRNALVQNIASGNTILLNAAGARLLQEAAEEIDTLVVHDWWAYQLITGAGGTVIHDDTPTILYRQHGRNQIGANDRLRAHLWRVWKILRGELRRWNDSNIAALSASARRLTPENHVLLLKFAKLRERFIFYRLRGFPKLGFYRQSRIAQAVLWGAMVLGLI